MHDPEHDASPFNEIPPLIVALVVGIALFEARFQLGARGFFGAEGIGWRGDAVERFGVFPALFQDLVRTGAWTSPEMLRMIAYPFLHYEALHAVFAGVLLLAMGKFVAERFAGWAVVAVLVTATLAGSVSYGLLVEGFRPLIGFYPAVYGLIGAYTFTLLLFLDAAGENRLKAFQLIGILVALQLIFNLIGGGGSDWIADIAGFVAGFLVSFLVAPGGSYRLRSLVDQTRRRD